MIPKFMKEEQYTGFTDKNGEMIYEGDRLMWGVHPGTVEWWKKREMWMFTIDYNPKVPECGKGWTSLELVAKESEHITNHST